MSIGVGLIEPRHHINVGYVARIMKNFGFNKLFLVDPIYVREDARRFAMHGHDILETAITTTLKELRQTSKMLVGTTALKGSTRLNVLRDAIDAVELAELINALPKNDDICIILGRKLLA